MATQYDDQVSILGAESGRSHAELDITSIAMRTTDVVIINNPQHAPLPSSKPAKEFSGKTAATAATERFVPKPTFNKVPHNTRHFPYVSLGSVGLCAAWAYSWANCFVFLNFRLVDLDALGAVVALTVVGQLLFVPATVLIVRVMHTPPGASHQVPEFQEAYKINGVMMSERQLESRARYCGVCQMVKPPRTHHCGKCGECVLRMDHHCPWVNNCIGYRNFGLFVRMCFWSFAYSVYGSGLLLFAFIDGMIADRSERTSLMYQNMVFFFVGLVIAYLQGTLLYHCLRGLKSNTTFIERLNEMSATVEAPNPYHLGVLDNIRAVLGPRVRDWINPFASLPPMADGVKFRTNGHETS